ncbi:MAG: PAS domain S-box protein, partial [Deltaproteobacteria bacterium]|nr:PAS domain S-box protein [Deltaproteobacteria bacterium]
MGHPIKIIPKKTLKKVPKNLSWENNSRLRGAINATPLVLWEVDPQGVFVRSEGKGLEALGLKPGQVVGQSAFEMYRDNPEILRHLQKGLAGESCEYEALAADTWFQTFITPLLGEDGKVSGVIGVSLDITERKKAQTALIHSLENLRESEARFRAIFNNSYLSIALADPQGRYISFNDAWPKFLGYSREELLQKTVEDITCPEDIPLSLENLKNLADGTIDHYHVEKRFIRKNGRLVWGDLSVSPLRDVKGSTVEALGIIQDIDTRKKAELALLKSESMYRQLVETTNAVTWEMELANNTFTYMSPQVRAMTGYPPHEWTGLDFMTTLIHPEDRAQALSFLVDHTLWGEDHSFSFRLKTHWGPYIWLRNIVSVISDEQEHKLLRGFMVDITAQMEAEAALHQSEARFRSLVESTKAITWELDVESARFTYVGPQVLKVLGYGPEEWTDFDFWSELIHPEDRQAAVDYCLSATAKNEDHSFEYRMVTKNGETIWIRDVGSVVVLGERRYLRGFLLDITPQKETEEAMRQAKERAEEATRIKDKFVSLVAHDLRAPISAVMSILQLMQTDPALPETETSNLEDVSRRLNNMLKMIEDVLNITRLQTGRMELKKQPVQWAMVAAPVLGMRYLAETKGITLANKVPDELRLYVDPVLFGQVFQNLVSNAVKFCSAGDTITLYVPESAPQTIAVTDTGPGIPADILPHLFRSDIKTTTPGTLGEPGTGLGLPLTGDIMKAHGGSIQCESKPGAGTTFFVTLPEYRPLVLLVDDEETTRRLEMLLLKPLHYDFAQAANGREALTALETITPQLIVLDINMPVMDGFTALTKIKEN